MSRHHITTRGAARNVLVITMASLLLASCAQAAASLSAMGQPSLSLAAPLTTLACTSTGACIALGASGSANAPTSAGQVRNHKGVWSALNVPPAPIAFLNDAACGASRCLVGGTRNGADLVWSVNTNDGAVSAVAGPAGGLVVRNLSCASDAHCSLIDQGAHGLLRLITTGHAGSTWGAAHLLNWAADKTTRLDCPGVSHCFVATTSITRHVTLRQTFDGGATWRLIATPAPWTSLDALSCTLTCVALVDDASGSAVASEVKGVWTLTRLTFRASSLACTTPTACLVVGHDARNNAAMAMWQGRAVHDVTLSYVPTALDHVACAPAVCVASGVTTVVSLRP
jgi:hypothetical protein